MEITLPAPVDTVWQAFRDPTVIRRWFGWDYEGLDDEIRVVFFDETDADEAGRTLQIGGHLFSLDDRGSETVVRVDTGSEASYDEIDEGWLSFLQQLRFVLARHPHDTRRSVYRNGETRSSRSLPAVELLGLGGVGDGGPYSVTTAVGDLLSGDVWFRSLRQLGLTVDQWGDGLLLVAQSPAVPGAASMSLCTYGLDTAVFTDLESRWTAWWDGHFTSGDG